MEVRNDSWAATLKEEQAWELFNKSRRCHWEEAAKWAVKEFDLPKMPSRTAFYNWLKLMQNGEHAHMIEMSLLAQEQAKETAVKYGITDEEHIAMLMSYATNATILAENPKVANQLIESAMAIKDRAQREKEIEIEDRKITVKEEELVIAKKKLEIYEKRIASAKKVCENGKMTPEEREAKIRAIFGL